MVSVGIFTLGGGFLSYTDELHQYFNRAGTARSSIDCIHVQAVQVKKKKLSPPRIPLEISGQELNVWYHSDPNAGLGLSLGAKLV